MISIRIIPVIWTGYIFFQVLKATNILIVGVLIRTALSQSAMNLRRGSKELIFVMFYMNTLPLVNHIGTKVLLPLLGFEALGD